MRATEGSRPIPLRNRPRLSWAWSGALAALVVIGLLVRQSVTSPPVLRIGTPVVVGKAAMPARVPGGVDLRFGPNSKVTRIDAMSIRLDQGWVEADVRHGSGLRILTPRLDVLDQGTRFQVGTGPNLDYVIVHEGAVSVSRGATTHQISAGQVLLARDQGEPSITSLPREKPEEEGPSTRLDQQDTTFRPSTAPNLDWNEGLKRLAERFSDVRANNGFEGGTAVADGTEFRASHSPVAGLRQGIREHFAEIAQAMAGGTVDSGEWEIPVAILQVSGVASPSVLPGDVYYVRLACRDGQVVWRFAGSMGSDADTPLTAKGTDAGGGQVSGPVPSLEWSSNTIYADGKPVRHILSMRLSDWPGEPKPTLRLELAGLPVTQSQRERRAMVADAAARVAKTDVLNLDGGWADVYYLDPERKHRFLIAWSGLAGESLCRLSDVARQGFHGEIVLGVLYSDSPLEEPKMAAGTYLLKFVLPGPSATPHLEIQSAGAWIVGRGVSLEVPVSGAVGVDHGGGSGWSPQSSPGYGTMDLKITPMAEAGGAFPFRFEVVGRPDDRSTRVIKRGGETSVRGPTKVWSEGWIRVRKP